MPKIQIISDTQEFKLELFNEFKAQLDELKKNFQPVEPPKYYTKKEVAGLFKVDLSTIHNWMKKGKLSAYGIGGRVYFKASDIEEVLTPIKK